MSQVVALAVTTGRRHPHPAATQRTSAPLRNADDFRMLAMVAIRESGIAYKVIARESGVTASTVSKLASGETQYPRLQTVIAILEWLGFTWTATKDVR